jgi:WD40 repeat protein
MNDIFISYSRRNKVFTQKLFEALKGANREVWADWEDIPAASDWEAEIKEGIQQAESILFVLSPEWIKSNECRKELEYAVKMGKRLIPILYVMVDPNEVPPELSKINWVYMRDTDDFGKAFDTLCSAMDTDLDWVKTHTRLTVRAVEWDKKNRNNSFLLRGEDLTDGEKFMSDASRKSPEPTHLQGEYVLASRKDATRRQRLTLIGVTVALVISVMLGVVALIQRQAAVLNAKMSFARELAATSLNNLNTDPERSLLLALQSVDITERAGQPIQPEGEDALRRAVQVSRLRLTIPAHMAAVWDVAFSPDGKMLATVGSDATVKIWNISSQTAGSFTGQPLYAFTDLMSDATSVAFSPDGSKLAAGSYDGIVIIWDMGTGSKLLTLSGHTASINKVAFSPDGTTIVTASNDNTAKVWGVDTGQLLFDLVGHTAEVTGVVFSPSGNTIVTAGLNGELILWNASTGEMESSPLSTRCPNANDIAIDPVNSYLAIANSCLTAEMQQLPDGNWIFDMTQHTDIVSAVAFSPDGSLMASASRDNTVIVVDAYRNTPKFTLIDSNDIYAMAFSPDGKYIATGDLDGQVKLWDANPINGYELAGVQAHSLRIDGMEFSPDQTHLITGSWDGRAFIWSLKGDAPIELVGHQSMVRDIAVSADGNKIITGGYDGIAILWDAATGKKLMTLPGDSQNVMAVAFSPDGRLAAGGLEGNIVLIWDVATGKELAALQSDDQYFIDEVAFSPDGATLAVANDNKTVTLWNTSTWGQIQTLVGHKDWVKGVAFSPDGKRLVTGSYDTTAIIWDTASWQPLFILRGHAQGINDVAFSPDGKFVATASVDGSAKIWDTSTGRLVSTLLASSNPVLSVAFSRDGNILATGSETGVLRFYYTHFEDVLSLAEGRITRHLTEDECSLPICMNPNARILLLYRSHNHKSLPWKLTCSRHPINKLRHNYQV